MLDILWKITGLALVDAVNPCTLTVQAILLSALVITKGRKEALFGGLLFVLTIFIMYFLYGLGILSALYVLGLRDILFSVLVALLAIMIFAQFYAYVSYRPGFVSLEMPMFLRPYAQKILNSVENPLSAIPAAVFCSVLLLPCSSGPYVTALGILASKSILDILLLIYYNFLFVSPMILITLLISLGTSPKRVLEWKEKHIRELHLVSALLLMLVLLMFIQGTEAGPALEGDSYVYLVYSPTCPHCHALMEFIDSLDTNVTVIKTTDGSIARVLEEYGYKWSGGVPLLFGIYDGNAIVVYGFPTDSQNVNGYFLGEDYEKNLCERTGGKEKIQNGHYLYCIMPDGSILGNEYSVKYLFEICSREKCKKIETQ